MASKIKPKVTDKWDLKFVRESRYMPFGSAMNAYGQINAGKGIKVDKFIDDMFLIAEACQTLIEDSLKLANEYQDRAVASSELPEITPEGEEVSTKQQKAIKLGQNWQKNYDKQSEQDEERIAQLRKEETKTK